MDPVAGENREGGPRCVARPGSRPHRLKRNGNAVAAASLAAAGCRSIRGNTMTTSVGYAAYIRVRTKPEKRDEFIGLVTELRANVLQNEPDTLVFEILQGKDQNEFVFF